MSSPLMEFEQALQRSLGSVVIGMQDTIRALTIALVARGHILIQSAPGLAKRCSARRWRPCSAAASSAYRAPPT